MEGIELLAKLCALPGISGYETAIRNFIKDQLKDIADKIEVDAMGNLIASHTGRSTQKLMLSAHIDEIGFMVQHIDDEGFIRFIPIGGFDAKTLTAQRVIVHGKKTLLV